MIMESRFVRSLIFLLLLVVAPTSESFQMLCRQQRFATTLYEANRSIGDVVQNLHGGKYRFDDPGINSIGREFAESLYSSESDEDDTEAEMPRPQWADEMVAFRPPTATVSTGTVVIQNQERTWERFFTKFVRTDRDAALEGESATTGICPMTVSPSQGLLAPRGGSGGRSDSVELTVEGDSLQGSWSLLVGTEEEKWHFEIR